MIGAMRGWHGMRMARRWAGESSRCEDPAPTVGIAGRSLGGLPPSTPFTPRRQQRERRRQITTRHAASLRPSRNGRIGFKPPYSKRGTLPKAPHGFNLLWRGLSPLAMKNISIKHLQLFEDRSDAACRVVVKTGVSAGGMVYVYCGGRGNLRVAKTPPLQSAFAGIPLRCIATDHHLRPHGHQRERRMGG